MRTALRLQVAPPAASGQQSRSIRLFEIFSKEGKSQRAEQLRTEMERGYFDDFRQLRKTEGRLFAAPDRLTAAQAAPRFPAVQVELPDGSQRSFPADFVAGSRMALLTAGLRAGSEDMLQSWSAPFAARFGRHTDVRWLDLAVIDSVVMRVWPFRGLIRSSAAREQPQEGHLCPQRAFFFGQADALMQAVRMSNRLTGYVYLMDGEGRLRWQAAGPPKGPDVETMLTLAEQLHAEKPGASRSLEQDDAASL